MIINLKNRFIEVSVSDIGAEIQSVKKDGIEFIWNGDKKFWTRRAPVLFPVVGRVKGKKYTYNHREYFMDQHGFARDKQFQCVKYSQTEVQFRLSYDKETLKIYPFRFHLDIYYRIEENRINICWKVSHEDDMPMYFSLGYHPAIMCPLKQGAEQEDYYIDFHTTETIQYRQINSENLVRNENRQLDEVKNGFMKFSKNLFDEDVLIIDSEKISEVSLLMPDKTPYFTMKYKAPLLGLWAPVKKKAPFVCIEPWYGCNDSETFEGELSEKDFIQKLDPKQTFIMMCTLSFL